MKQNSVRTSAELATLASNILADRRKEEIADILQRLVDELYLDEIAKRLSGSVLSNRRK